MNTKKIMISMVLLSSIMPALSPATIDYNKMRAEHPYFAIGEKGIIAFLGLSIFRLFWRDSKPVAKHRSDYKKFAQLSLILSDPQQYAENIYYWWDDEFVGQKFKDKCMIVKGDKTIKQSTKCPASGGLGQLFSILFVGDKTQKMMSSIGKIAGTIWAYKTINPGWARYLFNEPQKATGRFNIHQANLLVKAGYDPKKVLELTDIKVPHDLPFAMQQQPSPSALRSSETPDDIEETE